MSEEKTTEEFIDFGLTDEEKVIFEKVQQKIQNRFHDDLEEQKKISIEQMNAAIDKDPYFREDPIHKRKLTDFPREIRIQIMGEVSSSNEKGQLTSVEPLVNGYYHIPVPAKVDIQEKIDKFRNILESSFQDLADQIHFDEIKKRDVKK
jgi:hypothetical protein